MKNLYGLDKKALESVALSLGEKKFRGAQMYDWIYSKKVGRLREMKNLPSSFITALEEAGYGIFYPKELVVQTDPEDGTKKFLFGLEDGETVESVFMSYPFGYSACLSTQVGCAMGCSFCASGKNGKVRDLKAEEIAGQIVAMERHTGERISNIVLMGMGEPLDNYDEGATCGGVWII